jgi:protein O-GlcNAc transferase
LVKPLPKPGLPLQAVFIAVLALAPIAIAGAQEPPANSKRVEDAYRAGADALSRDDLQAALKDFQQVTRLAPAVEPGHSMLGFVLARLGRVNEAIVELEKALTLNPSDFDARMNLALAYEQTGAPAKAIPHFSKLEEAARGQGHSLPSAVLAAYARSLAATKQWNAATSKMQEAIATDPQNAELRDDFGSIYAQQQDWPRAQQQYVEAIHLKPSFAVAHLHLAFVLKELGQPAELDELEQAYKSAPQNSTIALELGKALALRGQDDRAISVLQHALELAPKSIPAAYQLGLAYQRTGKVQQALPLLQKAVAANPTNAAALTNLGLALCQSRRAKDALPFLQKAVSLAPDNMIAHQNLAAAYVTLGEFDEAVDALRAALKLFPNEPQLHYNLGVAFKMQDDPSQAIPELQTAKKLDPYAPEPPLVLGTIYSQTGRYEEAAQELSTSLKLRPENGEGWATLGGVYNSLGKFPEADSALREAIRQLPDQADPHLTLAIVLAQQDRQAEASTERKIAASLMRAHMNLQRAEVATNSGLSLLNSGNLPEAIVQFRDALSYDPNYVQAHVGLAEALERQGNKMDAASERQKADDLKKLADPQ